jgi:uridine phosphorylase
MTLHKNKYPILEFDSDKKSILMPDPDNPNKLPAKCIVTFSDYADKYAEQINAKVHSEFVTSTKTFKIYVGQYSGYDICFCEVPLGASASVQLVDHLFLSGVTQIIASGSCGALVDIPENEILVPAKALRDEGVSYHYLRPARFIELNRKAIQAIEQVFLNANLHFEKCITWTTDGFFRETKQMVEYRKEEGCHVVEMECAAMAACAEFRDCIFGQILFSGDSLANAEKHDQRNWGISSIEKAFKLSLDAVIQIRE